MFVFEVFRSPCFLYHLDLRFLEAQVGTSEASLRFLEAQVGPSEASLRFLEAQVGPSEARFLKFPHGFEFCRGSWGLQTSRKMQP